MSTQAGRGASAIRTLREGDLPAVLETWISANLQAHDFIPEKYWRENLLMVRQMLLQAQVLVCEAEGKVVGFSGIDNGHIGGVFVDAPMRSHGTGKALLNE